MSTSLPRTNFLPCVADADWSVPHGYQRKKIANIHDALERRRMVWWRRDNYRQPAFSDTTPKWHVFASRTRGDTDETRWQYTWRALCGNTRVRLEIIDGPFRVRVSTPKKVERCIPCEAALNAITADAARESTNAAPESESQ